MDWWHKLVPSIDIYGLNSYGAGASLLAEELEKEVLINLTSLLNLE